MANLYQRMVNLAALRAGWTIHFVEDPDALVERLPKIQPSALFGVPRFYEKLLARLRERGADAVLGTRMKFMVCGSAPAQPAMFEAFDRMGLTLLEAYGISENTIPIAINRPEDRRAGSVGRPVAGNEVRLAPDGEILVRGPGLFRGYVGDAPAGPARFTADGYYRTGDLGRRDAEGFLYLKGRKRELIRLSTGRTVAPSIVEAAYGRAPAVRQVVVFGHGRPHLVALISVDPLRAQKDAAARTPDGRSSLDAEFARFERALAPHERIRRYAILDEPFSIERGELTSSLKLRRDRIEERHRECIEQLYVNAVTAT
jgi:long-chain acyl-CoA synthetase